MGAWLARCLVRWVVGWVNPRVVRLMFGLVEMVESWFNGWLCGFIVAWIV